MKSSLNQSSRSSSHSAPTRVRFMTCAGMTAALYLLFTELSAMLGLSGGAVQLRLSEALTILPAILSGPSGIAAGIGLFAGCLLSNVLTGCALWDIVFGSLATLLGAAGTYLLRRHPYLAWIPPALANTLIIPLVLIRVYGAEEAFGILTLTVGMGEILSCGVLGLLLCRALTKRGLSGGGRSGNRTS